jgi:regulatory protein
MKIVRVVRKDDKNVVIYFDNDEKLILSIDTFFNSGLKKGDEVSADRYSFFIEQNILYHIKQRALSYLSRRLHSEKELLLKLKGKSYDEKLIKIVLNNLKNLSFLDDRNFAVSYIEEKLKRKKWGINKIRAALFSKGVSSNIIDEAISKFDNTENNLELVNELSRKKIEQLKKRNIEDRKIYEKVMAFLINRGFEYSVSSEVCNKIMKQDFD